MSRKRKADATGRLPTESSILLSKTWRRIVYLVIAGLMAVEGYQLFVSVAYAEPGDLQRRADSLPALTAEEQREVEEHSEAILKILKKGETARGPSEVPNSVPPKDPDLLSRKIVDRVGAVHAEVEAQRSLVKSHESKSFQRNLTHICLFVGTMIGLIADLFVLRRAVRLVQKDEVVKRYRELTGDVERERRELRDAKRSVDRMVDDRVKRKLAEHEAEMKRQRDEAEAVTRRAAQTRDDAERTAAAVRVDLDGARALRSEAHEEREQAAQLRQRAGIDRSAAEAERKAAALDRHVTERHLRELRAIAEHASGEIAAYLRGHPESGDLLLKYLPAGESATE